jgi:hypothetical protein
MQHEPVKFKQVRDFGDVFNATFSFIGAEYKNLGKAVLYYALPFLIITAISGVLLSIEQQKFYSSAMFTGAADLNSSFSAMADIYKYTFLILFAYMIGMSMLQCTLYSYIKLYVNKGKDQFTVEDVWHEMKQYILPVIGISIILGILIFIGMVLCLLPGIILAVYLSLIFPAYIFEDRGFGDSFNRSFQLTGQKWWMTLGLIIVSIIMVYMIALLFSIPAMLLGFKSMFASLQNLQNYKPVEFSTAFYIVNSITSLITYVVFSIPSIIMAFHYFSMVEVKERPSLHEKIEQIG